ncbi:MAG: cytochrome c-type biogenesis protein CcmH [Persicimonas sp.]
MSAAISTWPKRLACAALLISLGTATPALAQEEGTSEPRSGQVSSLSSQVSQEIESPYCPGKTLAMCPSGGAADVRREIQDLAREGKDRQEIKDAIIDKYGEEFRLVEPPAEDNYTLLGVVGGGLVCFLAAIWFISARRKDAVGTEGADGGLSDDELSDEERAYLEELRDEYQD